LTDKVIGAVASKFLFGLGAGIITDAFIEVSRFPILNDSGLFGGSMSNFETLSYAVVAGGIVAGLVDLYTNAKVLGFGKELLPFLAGYGIGIQQYEGWIADKVGLRAFNPYSTVQGLIPQIQ
jgi:hypothetical protein